MLARQLKEIELRKCGLVEQSRCWRRDFNAEMEPLRLWVNKAELGFKLAGQARDLLSALTPILLATQKPQGNALKAVFGVFSNWPLLKAVWEGFRIVRSITLDKPKND